MTQDSSRTYVRTTENESRTAQKALSPNPPPGKSETTDTKPSALASVGAQAGHPATNDERKAPSAAIPECFLEARQKVENRYVAMAEYEPKRSAFKAAAEISARAYGRPKFPTVIA